MISSPAMPAALQPKEITFEYGPMGMMTETQNGAMTITNVLIGGQADKSNLIIGDIITGINGIACVECMSDATDTEELKKMMTVAVRPINLNVNKIFSNPNKAKPVPKPAVPPAPKLDPGMEQFKSLMIQGACAYAAGVYEYATDSELHKRVARIVDSCALIVDSCAYF